MERTSHIITSKFFWCSWRHWWRHSVTSKYAFYIHVKMKLSQFSHECFDIASQNFIHRCILADYRALFIFKVNGLITRSPGHKTGRMGEDCRGVKSISIINQYMQSYWFSKQSKINIIYNISVITITITMTIILANFGKYAISDCPFITCQNLQFLASMFVCRFVCLSVC